MGAGYAPQANRTAHPEMERFQVIHLPAVLPTGMLGRSYGKQGTGRNLFNSPSLPLKRNGSMSQSPPAAFPCLEPLSRSRLSLAHGSFPFPGCHRKVAAPGLLLRYHTGTVH